MTLIRALLISLLLFSGLLAYGQTMSLDELIKESQAEFFWGSGREIGLLIKDDRQVRFSLQSKNILLGDTVRIGGIERQNGQLIFEKTAVNAILGYLNPRQQRPVSEGSHRIGVILIDAGHGGKDPGSIGLHDGITVKEKDICLTVALELEQHLKKSFPDKKILMSRRTDQYITLEDRVAMANSQVLKDNEAELYISIHANSAFNKTAKGFEVWRLPDSVTRRLYEKEEMDHNARQVLNALLNEEYLAESTQLASSILKAMDKILGAKTVNRGIREQSWFVVKNARMAAVLVEIGFVSNREEALQLNDKNHLKLIAKTLYTGLIDFINYFEKENDE